MKKLGSAVIGCGAISKNHGAAFASLKNAELLYCFDTKPEKAAAFAERFGGKPLASFEELLLHSDIDVVHICTPHFTHPQLAIAAMKSGKHVFCEKPMAILPQDAEEMIKTANETKRYLGICFQNRLNPASIKAKKILDDKTYGEITAAIAYVAWDRHGKYYTESDWRGYYATEGGGCIINQSIHTIDLIDYLCGGVKTVTAVSMRLRDTDDYEVDDSCMANFTLSNGSVAVGHFSNCCTGSKRALVEIICEKARLTVDQKALRIETADGTEVYENEVATGEKSEWGLSHGKLITEFYSCIAENRAFFVNGESGIHAVRIIDAIKSSNGKPITIK